MSEINYNEQVLNAISIVVQGEIKKVHFDQTIRATIIGDEAADEGRYWCSNGFSEFWAYSTEVRYRKNDKVLVTIPEGDYSNATKVIISKQADENNSPLILASPLSMMVDLTNNMITGEIEEVTWANYGRVNSNNRRICKYSWDKDTKDFINSAVFQYGEPFYDSGINQIYETSITRLGFSAQFSTWLTDYATISGNYGIAIELTFRDNDREIINNFTELKSQPVLSEIYYKNQNPGGFNAVELSANERAALFDIFTTDAKRRAGISFTNGEQNGTYIINGQEMTIYKHEPTNEFVKYITFDSEEFFGDIYGYDTYYTNETVFDISDFSKYAIIRIRAWLYQRDNFRTMDSDYVEAPGENEEFSNINPNIFMKDPYLCLGVESSEFISDKAELITSSSSTFYKTLKTPDLSLTEDTSEKRRLRENLKNIHLRWVHKDENTGIIRMVELDEYPEDYEVRWYRWALGKPSCDEFSGAHWERFYGCKDTPNGEGDYAITEEEMKSVSSWSRDPTNALDAQLSPNINRSQEKIKAIILKVEQPKLTTYIDNGTSLVETQIEEDTIYRFAAETNELIFLNDDEVRNEQTYIDMNALSIRFDDGSNGHYFLYNRAGNVSKDSDLEIRTLTLVFDEEETDVFKKSRVHDSAPITWHFPESMTMIIPATSAGLDGKPANVYTFNDTVSVGYFIKKSLSRQDNNNTVTAQATIDGVTYSATVQMAFGTAGTSGSDYTLDIVWNDNALDVTNPVQGLLIGQVGLYDSAGNQILGDSDTITDLTSDYQLSYDWEVAELIDDTAGYDYSYEENGVLYPIYKTKDDATFDQASERETGTSDEESYGGYYYFVEDNNALRERFNKMCGGENSVLTNSNTLAQNINEINIKNNLKSSTETLAFYDLDQEKFVYLKDYFYDNSDLLTDVNSIKEILYQKQLYRKRDVENLRVIKTIKNEQFYKDLVDIFVTNSNLLYTNLFKNKTVNDIQNLINSSAYNLRLKSASEIGASIFKNFYGEKTTVKESVAETVNSNSVVLTETIVDKIPYSQFLQEIFKDVTASNFADKVVSIDTSKIFFKNDDSYLSFESLNEDIQEQYYEILFYALFDASDFYYNYLKENINNINREKPSDWENTDQTEGKKNKFFYAQKIIDNGKAKLRYIFQYIAAATSNIDEIVNGDFAPGSELYLCFQTTKNNNIIKQSLIDYDDNFCFSYEWPKPKIDYKAIENVEGMEEDLESSFEPQQFAGSGSKVWNTKTSFGNKTEKFYKLLASKIFNDSTNINSSQVLTNRINDLSVIANEIQNENSNQSVDKVLQYYEKNSGDSSWLTLTDILRPNNENTVEYVLEQLSEELKKNYDDNWVTTKYSWRIKEGLEDKILESEYEIYTELWKTIFKTNPETILSDAVLTALNAASSPYSPIDNFTANNSNSVLLTHYKVTSSNKDYILESLYHYITNDINSVDKQKTLYQWLLSNSNSDSDNKNIIKPEGKSLEEITFPSSENSSKNFYRVLAEYCGIDNIYANNEENNYSSDKLIFYSAFNRSIPIDTLSEEEQLNYKSNLLIQNPGEQDYYRLSGYLNSSSNALYNLLNYSNINELEEQLTFKLDSNEKIELDFDKVLLDFLNGAFGNRSNTLSINEKHNLISTVFSATSSSVINSYISDKVINSKDSVANDNEVSMSDFIAQQGSLTLDTSSGTITSDKAFKNIIALMKVAADEKTYVDYFPEINRLYRIGYNADSLYKITNTSDSYKWRLLFLLLCSVTTFPETSDAVYDFFSFDENLSNLNSNLFYENDTSLPLYLLSSDQQSRMPTSLQADYGSLSYTDFINSISELNNNNIYYYVGSTTNETSTTYHFQLVCSKENYIKLLKTNLFNSVILNTNVLQVNDSNNYNYDLNSNNKESLCKYILQNNNAYYTGYLKAEKDEIGAFPNNEPMGLSIANYSTLKTKIPFINYLNDNKYDNISEYLQKSLIISGQSITISKDLLESLCTELNNSQMIFMEKYDNDPLATNGFTSICFNLLINEDQNTKKETILSESLISLNTFKEAFLVDNNYNKDSVDSTEENQITIENFPKSLFTGTIYQLVDETNQRYQNILIPLQDALNENNKNPISYEDTSLAFQGWAERLYNTIVTFYNGFNADNSNLIKLNDLVDSSELSNNNYFGQIYSTLFGVEDTASIKFYNKTNNFYDYVGTEAIDVNTGPVINYVLLLSKFISSDEILDNKINKKTGLSNNDLKVSNSLVYIKKNDQNICLNDLLKLSSGQIITSSLKSVYLYLEDTSGKYYSNNDLTTQISQNEACGRIFNLVLVLNNFNNEEDCWAYLLKLFNTNSSITNINVERPNDYQSLFNLYYYGNILDVDSQQNFLYNLDTELEKYFNSQGTFTEIGQDEFFNLLTLLENSNTQIYKLKESELDAVKIESACMTLWDIVENNSNSNNYIENCKTKINNAIDLYSHLNLNYSTLMISLDSTYNVLYNDEIKLLSEFFDGSTIFDLVTSYNILRFSTTSLLVADESGDFSDNNILVFNYQNTNNLKPFIKVNDNYIIDPYYQPGSQKNYKGYRSDETYYFPKQREKEQGKTVPLVYSPKGERNRTVWISPNPSLAGETDSIKKLMSSLSVLKITLSNFGDYDLVAYFPIALKQGTTRYDDLSVKFTPGYLQGATYVRYTSLGETDFEKNPYRLFSKEMNIKEETGKHTEVSYNDLRLKNSSTFGWQIIHPTPEAGISTNFIPALKESQGIRVPDGALLAQLPILQPITVYIPEAVPYGVSCYYNNEAPIWTQAIYCYEDNYPSTTINKWDGKTILTDNDSGTIVSSALAAGKKESDNTFTGVMMGDWSRSDTDPAIAAHTGLFGFNHGSMSYAFKDDGTGFIGKDGRGRIVFDGNKSQIYSNNWKGTEQCGMFLDIDDGVIKLQSEKINDDKIPSGLDSDGNVEESPVGIASQRYITISSKASTYPLSIGIDSSPSQRKFKVKWNGSAYLTDAYLNNVYAKGYIYATGGVFDGDIISKSGTISGPHIEGADITCKKLVAKQEGNIAGWTINQNALVNPDGTTILYGAIPDVALSTGEIIDNPFATSIVTNRIVLQAESPFNASPQRMAIGFVTGMVVSEGEAIGTSAMGIEGASRIIIKSTNNGEEANGFAMGLKTPNGNMVLQAQKAYINLGNVMKANTGALAGKQGVYISGEALVTDIPAENQVGFYARFA